jgi:hypothetical protein
MKYKCIKCEEKAWFKVNDLFFKTKVNLCSTHFISLAGEVMQHRINTYLDINKKINFKQTGSV